MKFSVAAATLLSAFAAAENVVTFESKDSTSRTLIFTPTDGSESIDKVTVSGGASVDVTIPEKWIGNWYAVSEGSHITEGMLGEVTFQGWNDLTYFDVSAIVNASDHDGVKEMWPASGKTPTSGCSTFPCNNAYYLPDDVQTKSTTETHLICTLGGNGSSKRSVDAEDADTKSYPHKYVTGRRI